MRAITMAAVAVMGFAAVPAFADCELGCTAECRQEASICNGTANLEARIGRQQCEADANDGLVVCDTDALDARSDCVGLCGPDLKDCGTTAKAALKACKDTAKIELAGCEMTSLGNSTPIVAPALRTAPTAPGAASSSRSPHDVGADHERSASSVFPPPQTPVEVDWRKVG